MSKIETDRLVWDSFRQGSKEALEFIYAENYSSLFHYGLKFEPNDEVVKDLIHELFVDLIDSGTKLSSTDNIRFYLLRALRNKIQKQLSGKVHPITSADTIITEFSLSDSIEVQLIKTEIEAELKQQIMESVSRLSEKQQEIIYLRFYNDMSYQHIADLFGVKIQTVRNLMSRAIASLKEDIENNSINRHIILFVLKLSV